jgi:glucosamine--fructose-6-phosphate aminotransferase (isomerizing)
MVPTRSAHPYWMYEEMTATPEALDRLLSPDEAARERLGEVAKRLASARRIYLTGCGTAYHAALAGAAFLRDFTDDAVDARPVQAFELSHYERSTIQASDALIALSHSGKPVETNAALAAAREAGAYCVTVTGYPDSPAATSADAVLDVGYGDVKSFAYTISYSLMLAELASLAAQLASAAGRESAYVAHEAQVRVLPQMHRDALALDSEVRALVERLRGHRRWIFAGAGGNVATALEVSLKMQETNYTSSFGMEMEEVLHGPAAALGDSVLVVIAPPGAGRVRAFDLLRAARTLDGPTVALGEVGDTELAAAADTFLALPECPEDTSPAPYHVPLHLLSYWLAVATGTNPDLMRRTEQRYLDARKSYVL